MKTKNKFEQEYEVNHIAMKQWNENRAKSEEEGLKKFYTLMSDPMLHPSKFKKP